MSQPADFGFGEEERLVRDQARRLLEACAGGEARRERLVREAGLAYSSPVPPVAWDPDLWERLVDLGWPGLPAPSEAGGSGMKMVAVAALAEEVGRVALPSPLLATWAAALVLRELPPERALPWLRRLCGGDAASLAITPADGSWELEATELRAEPLPGGGVRLDGSASFVQEARKARFFVVSARSPDGLGLYCVDAAAAGVVVHPDRILDLTRDQGRLELRSVQVPAEAVVAAAGAGEGALRRALPALLTVVSGDLCGAAEWQLQTTAAYARVRTQFERPLGFFQAVKHPLVDMMLAVDRARSLLYHAACAIDHEPERAERCARLAKAAASDAADFCCGRSVQLHGGIGFTWECDVHVYFKRQKHNQFYLGDAIQQRARLAELQATQ